MIKADEESTIRSTAEVLDHHLKCLADRDLEGVLADYSAEAVFFGPEAALRGPMQLNLYLKNVRRGVAFMPRSALMD
jgi:hypothetical protein